MIGEYLGKGDPIFIDGRLKLEEWEDKATGQKRTKLTVVANSFQFVGKKADRDAPRSEGSTVPAKHPDADEDSIPF